MTQPSNFKEVNLSIPEQVTDISQIYPKDIIKYLEEHIIGQEEAVNAVACAVYLKLKLDALQDIEKRENSRPSNMILMGPTGVGKTEIARRISRYLDVPFVNFPVTRISERGYVGGKVEDIVSAIMGAAARHYENKLISSKEVMDETKKTLKEALKIEDVDDGKLTNIKIIVVEKSEESVLGLPQQLPEGLSRMFGATHYKMDVKLLEFTEVVQSMAVSETIKDKSREQFGREVIEYAQRAIVFLDEIDKLIETDSGRGMVSRAGVQFEILPFVEGSSYETPYGILSTDRILFISAGAFSDKTSPDMLIPELQGRLPVRVNLHEFKDEKIYRKIMDAKFSIVNTQTWIMQQDYPEFTFTDEAKDALANYAFRANKIDNVGARILDRLIQAITRYYLLKTGKGPVEAKHVHSVLEKDIEKLEKGKTKKKVGF